MKEIYSYNQFIELFGKNPEFYTVYPVIKKKILILQNLFLHQKNI